jgi:tetratricopeptide (TPR) repeat protein
MNENHPIWGDNIQMSEKQMEMLEETDAKIVLRGFGNDSMGSSFADYGLTLNKKNGIIDEVTLNMFDRNIKILYKKASKKESTQVISFEQIKSEFMTGANALNSNNFSKAISAFNSTLNLIQLANHNDKELESSCHYNIGNSYKFSNQLHEAIDSFSSALKIKATNEDAYLGLSDCYFLLENNDSIEKAINILSTCISYFPNNKIAHLNKGVGLFKLNRYHDAFTSFKKAQQLGDQDAGVYIEAVRKYIN